MTKLDAGGIAAISVEQLKGVAAKQAEKLTKLSIYSIQDLLLHLPFRYEDRTRITPLTEIKPGMTVVVQGEITSNDLIPARRRMMFCWLSDGNASVGLRFFNFYPNQRRQLAVGQWVRCFGEVRASRQGYEIIHPEYRLIEPNNQDLEQQYLTPIYPTTEGVRQASLQRWVDLALNYLQQNQIEELLSKPILKQLQLPSFTLKEAITFLHRPPADADLKLLDDGNHPAQMRLISEELLAHQISMLTLKKNNQQFSAPAIDVTEQHLEPLMSRLPFSPTGAQQRVYEEILTDIIQPTPMMRLVQGDVGSGKTLVAMMAAIQVLENNHQVALMAPTELLSEQHFEQFQKYFEPLSIKVVWLTSKLKAAQRRETLALIESEQRLMVIGTHALFQDHVIFKSLGLMIVDEQHRFGVHQRLSLKEKGISENIHPHQLVMTATPIPRTLAMSAYADLDTSVIDELPPGRTAVATLAMTDDRRPDLINRLRTACEDEQRQVYWVCTLIEESENLQCQAAEETHIDLQKALPNLTIGLVHGRMKSKDKSAVMNAFKAAEIDILVATTVIEVGVDVPNASLMVIENAERLGLAQLHQLRGRVGRGAKASHCILLYRPPLSIHSEQRIAVMRETNDGFIIAEKDLELRGPGEVLGTKQTGIAEFKIADLYRDRDLLPGINKLAAQLVDDNWPGSEQLVQRWLGDKDRYAKV